MIEKVNEKLVALIEKDFFCEKPNMVLGDGKIKTPFILLVGEAPGSEEVVQKRPFVGKAGKNLDKFLQSINLRREELYVTNVVKFRPTKPGKTGKPINRTPTDKEIAAFTPLLMEETNALSPQIIVTLGNTPLYAYTGEKNIGKCHGVAKTVNIGKKLYLLYPLYHPAAVIYNRSLQAVYNEDLASLKALVETMK